MNVCRCPNKCLWPDCGPYKLKFLGDEIHPVINLWQANGLSLHGPDRVEQKELGAASSDGELSELLSHQDLSTQRSNDPISVF